MSESICECESFPELGVPFFRGPNNKDYNILGSILGSPFLGNYHVKFRFACLGLRVWAWTALVVLGVTWSRACASLNSLKGSCIGDYIGNHDTGYSGDTKSLDPTP